MNAPLTSQLKKWNFPPYFLYKSVARMIPPILRNEGHAFLCGRLSLLRIADFSCHGDSFYYNDGRD